MSEGARIDDIDAIKTFRVQLAKFAEAANLALDDAQSEINRTLNWLEGEQTSFWNAQIRKRQELLAKAQQALRDKTLYKDVSGRPPSAVEEHKAVAVAKRNLAEAEQKMANTKSWCRRFPKEIAMYHGGVKPFANTLAGGIPAALAQLTNSVILLERYTASPVEAGSDAAGQQAASSAGENQVGTMARGRTAGPSTSDPEAVRLRQAIPAESVLAHSSPPPDAPLSLPAINTAELGNLPAPDMTSQTKAAANVLLSGQLPADADWIVVRMDADRLFIGPANRNQTLGPAERFYNLPTAAFLQDRPELNAMINLSAGTMALFGPEGLKAVFNAENRRIWPQN